MWTHEYDSYPTLAHTLVPADPERIARLAADWQTLSDDPSDARQAQLRAMIEEWWRIDHELDLRDRLAPREFPGLATALVELKDELRTIPVEQRALAEALEALDLESPVPRSLGPALLRSLRRRASLVGLGAPAVLIVKEAEILHGLLTTWETAPHWADDDNPSWDKGSTGLLHHALRAAIRREPNGTRGIDIGFGLHPNLVGAMGFSASDLDRLLDVPPDGRLEDLDGRVGAWPWVPRNRLHSNGSRGRVWDHGEGTGPFGWCGPKNIDELADALASTGLEGCEEAAVRVRNAEAAVGCLELLTYESDAQRNWLVDPTLDGLFGP